MRDGKREVIAKTTLRSAGTDVASKLNIVINVCTYKEDGRIERRLEICGKDDSTIAVIDICPAGEILIDVPTVYGDNGSVESTSHSGREGRGRSCAVTIKGHQAVVTDDKRPAFKKK